MHYVLSNYPLSGEFRKQLEIRLHASPKYINLADLRKVSLMHTFKSLLALRGRVLSVAYEDESSAAILPVMRMLGSIARVRVLQVVHMGAEPKEFSRWGSLWLGVGLVIQSTKSLLAVAASVLSMRRLMRASRIIPQESASRRVAYLNCNLWFGVKAGGSVGHISGVVNSLMDAGYALDFFTVGGRLLVDDRASLHALRPPQILGLPFEANYFYFSRECTRQIRKSIADSAPGFIYQRMSLGNYSGVSISRSVGIPLVLEYNGSEAWVAKNWGTPLRFHKAAVLAEDVCLRHAHVVVTISDVLVEELVQRGVERERIVVYPNCIDPKMFDPARFSAMDLQSLRSELHIEPNDVVATFIGTFGQWHGVDLLAQAIRKLFDEDRRFLEDNNLKFLLVGDGQKMHEVRQHLDVQGIEKFVHLTGLVAQKQAPKYLAASDILLSPHVPNADGSAFFGSPTKLFEYLAMAKGIVASDLDQLGQVLSPSCRVEDLGGDSAAVGGSVALLVRPGDADSLMRGIRALATRPDLRKQLGDNARRLALAKFTWGHHVNAILEGLSRVRRRKTGAG